MSYGEDAGEFQMRVVALEASGASVWEWNVRRDEMFVGPDVDAALGHPGGTLRGNAEEWLQHLHASDRERMRLILAGIREKQGGDITTEFRLRRADGGYLALRAARPDRDGAPDPGAALRRAAARHHRAEARAGAAAAQRHP